ncbi:MAG: helix-turn-helix domain-containing protein, partial [Nitrospirota bacterium]
MRKLEVQDADIIKIAVQQEIERSEESRYDHRLHAILMICSGVSCNQVAELFGHSPRTVQYWLHRFEEKGFAGLHDTERPGRPIELDQKQRQTVGTDLRQSPRNLGYAQSLWDGRLLSHHLSKEYRVALGIRQCQRLFHQLGFRRRKPRPLIAKATPELQQEYKKTHAIS